MVVSVTARTGGHRIRWTLLALLACITGGVLLFMLLAYTRRRVPVTASVPNAQPDVESAPEPPAAGDLSMVDDLRSQLARKPRAELFRRAKERSIPGTLSMSKDELVDALLADDA